MASRAALLFCACVLLPAQGVWAAIGAGQNYAVEKDSSRRGSSDMPYAGRVAQVLGADTGPLVASHAEGSSTVQGSSSSSLAKGAVHSADAAVLQRAAAQWREGPETVDRGDLLATWDVERPCSQWYGVTCDSATGRVTELMLPGLGDPARPLFRLSGPLSPELGSLPELRSLVLARNYFGYSKTPFPEEWAGLGGLSHLDLSGNSLGMGGAVPAPVPQVLCNLTSLTYLNLADTGFKAPLPQQFHGLSRIAWLDLSGVNLNGGDIHILGSLSGLMSLFLRQAFLLLTDVAGLSRLRSLEVLDLSDNPLGSCPTFLKHLPHLVDLRLSSIVNSEKEVSLPAWLGSLQQLTSLDLSRNSFVGSLPAQLAGLSRLARLDLGGNRLSGTVPAALLNSPNLADLDLSDNKLNLTAIAFGTEASASLKALDLSLNSLKGSIPSGLSGLTSLESLSLSGNQLTGTMPHFLWTVPTLTRLDLSRNQLTGLGFSSRRSRAAASLRNLHLLRNDFQGSIPRGLSSLTSLTFFSLSYNSLTGSIPAGLGALTGLMALYLSSNQLTGSLPGSLVRPGRVLRVANNQLSGHLPRSALSLVARRLQAAANGEPLPGLVGVSGNYLTGPCYSSLLASLECPSDAMTCGLAMRSDLSALGMNCLEGCRKVPFGYAPEQRSRVRCSRFCGSHKPHGPCNGHGSCSLKGPKRIPTCACRAGYVAPASNPGTCVVAPKGSG